MKVLRGLRRVFERSPVAQGVAALVACAAAGRLVDGGLPLVWWAVQSVLLTALSLAFAASARRRDRRAMGGVAAGLHLSVERQLARGQVPRDPREREAMRRLVDRRLGTVGGRRWLFGLLVAVLPLLPVLWVLLGSWAVAALWLLFALVLDSWLIALRRRNLRLLRRMDHALAA